MGFSAVSCSVAWTDCPKNGGKEENHPKDGKCLSYFLSVIRVFFHLLSSAAQHLQRPATGGLSETLTGSSFLKATNAYLTLLH